MRLPPSTALAVTLVLSFAASSASAQTAPSDPARYLAANCANCHGTAGRAVPGAGMPALAGLSRVYFIEQMTAFREGKRPATIMHQLAKGYSDEQISLLADYFSKQKPQP